MTTSTINARNGFGSDGVRIQGKYSEEAMADYEPEKTCEEKAQSQIDRIPAPTGYRILLIPYMMKPKSKGGIILTGETVQQEQLATTVAYVVAVGPDAYKDPKFTEGPWCKQGDYVLFGRYAGAKITMNGNGDNLPMRLINDDEVLAVIKNPEDYVGAL